jgi:hypothetical protein
LLKGQTIAQNAALQLLNLITAGNHDRNVAQPVQIGLKQERGINHNHPSSSLLHNTPQDL